VSKASTPYLFLAPFMMAFVLFLVAPVGYAMYLSLFIKKRSLDGPVVDVFGGLANYTRALTDSEFLTSLLNVAKFGLLQIPIMILLALLIALILEGGEGRLRRFLRIVAYLPYTFPGVIAGLAWSFLYSKNLSPINQLLKASGGEPLDILAPAFLLAAIGNIVTWSWTGYNAIVLFSALQGVPREIYEAARVDGANELDIIWRIKLPMLRPALLLTLVFSLIGTMQIFAEPYVLQASTYVADSITPNVYVYYTASRDNNFSYAAALAIMLGAVTFICSGFFLRLVARTVD
jgi:multiple sugar transport system permease protein